MSESTLKSNRLWVDKYAPINTSQLAVHPKKVEEVSRWCDSAHGAEILLLTGPPGCGKTACVNALPKLDVSVWNFGDINSFTDFILRASRYQVIGENSDIRRILLIETLPNIIYEEPSLLHDTLIKYKLVGKQPLVLILSDSCVLKYSQFSLLPKSLQQKLNIKIISFNTIAVTLMKKALINIAINECPNKMKDKQLQEVVSFVYNESGGDIRSAINNLQVLLTGVKDIKQNFDMSKDVNLSIFRALGKILYCKRETDEKAIIDHNKKFEMLPFYSIERHRAPLLFSPEEVFDNSGLEQSTFVNYLHENHVDFIEDIHQVSNICDFFSFSDHLLGNKSLENLKLSGNYSVSLVSRAIAFFNESKTKNTWRPLRKSPLVDVHKKQWQLRADVLDVIESDSSIMQLLDIVSTKPCLLDILPYSRTIKRRCLMSLMYKSIFEKIEFGKKKDCIVSHLEDNVAVESNDESNFTAASLRKFVKSEQCWRVCKEVNEENVIIDD